MSYYRASFLFWHISMMVGAITGLLIQEYVFIGLCLIAISLMFFVDGYMRKPKK